MEAFLPHWRLIRLKNNQGKKSLPTGVGQQSISTSVHKLLYKIQKTLSVAVGAAILANYFHNN